MPCGVVVMARPMSEEMTPEEYEAAREEWMLRGEDVVESLSASGQPFSFDMVRRELPEALHPNHYGQLMKRHRVKALVDKVQARPSSIPTRRGGLSYVYVGRGWDEVA